MEKKPVCLSCHCPQAPWSYLRFTQQGPHSLGEVTPTPVPYQPPLGFASVYLNRRRLRCFLITIPSASTRSGRHLGTCEGIRAEQIKGERLWLAVQGRASLCRWSWSRQQELVDSGRRPFPVRKHGVRMYALVQPPSPFTRSRILVRGQGHPWWEGLSVKAMETIHRRRVQQPIFLSILYSVSRQLTLSSQGMSFGEVISALLKTASICRAGMAVPSDGLSHGGHSSSSLHPGSFLKPLESLPGDSPHTLAGLPVSDSQSASASFSSVSRD